MTLRRELPPEEMNLKNARRHGRVRCAAVASSLGLLLDVSASGCRVQLKRGVDVASGVQLKMTVHGLDGPFEVEVRVAWVRRAGWFKREAGLQFDNVTAAVRQHLANLARAATIAESLGWAEPTKRSA